MSFIAYKVLKSFDNTKRWLEELQGRKYLSTLELAGEKGVAALQVATPKDTGKTAASWRYEIKKGLNTTQLIWINDNKASNGDVIAILIQNGHATRGGRWVQGRDYINPALKPVFDEIFEMIRADTAPPSVRG